MYFLVRDDPEQDYGITDDPVLPDGVSFQTGMPIPSHVLSTPLVFSTDNTMQFPPLDLGGMVIPVMSRSLVDSLLAVGVENMQIFPAIIENSLSGERWTDDLAVNVLGLIACANLDLSSFNTIVPPDGYTIPLVDFEELVIDESRTRGAPMFRLAESPDLILIAEPTVTKLLAMYPSVVGVLFESVRSE